MRGDEAMMLLMLALWIMLSFAGCVTTKTMKDQILECTIQLIDKDVQALNAHKVCSEIYKRR